MEFNILNTDHVRKEIRLVSAMSVIGIGKTYIYAYFYQPFH